MPYLDGEDRDVPYPEGVLFDPVETEIRYTGILYIGKGVGEFADDGFLSHFIRIEVHGPVLEEIVGPHVIEAGDMVFMGMGEDDGVELADPEAQHLVTKVGCRINHDRSGGRLNEDTGTKSFVPCIGGGAYFTGTSDHWNPGAGAGTQESDF